ncbi:xylulokinase [Lichenibacterium ramalinae]|uniref:Xylulose kinase n=1 Tax=Lichenibacterium ramalinae TaxID=2316527 RepID=A0A4Q2RG74_9HYPH|nr:xylulokinase [Lichenibacterium ramalinae]RYB07206.1 xylulokinase [Lichenibacterium ramalinae]
MFVGIDIGTTSVKSVLMAEDGTLRASAAFPVPLSRPQAGWSEQDPEHWWSAVCDTLDALAAAEPRLMAGVTGIGLSGHMHGATLLGADDVVLRPAILWNDGRAAAECAEIEAACPEARAITGNIVMPGFTAPKVAWVRKHEPAVFERIRKVLLPKDYVRLKLTGDYASDMSDAAGTCWLDVGARRWSDPLLAATGLTRDQMPALYEGTEATGRLREALRVRFGMDRAPVVAGGAGDNAASACGIGAVEPGAAFLSLGTSGVLFVSNARFSPNTAGAVHAFCHALPDTWHQMGVILSATDSLNWFARLVGAPAPELTAALGERVAKPSPALFMPYLSGERTPHNDAGARGGFLGLDQTSSRQDLTQAVLEGVAFAFRDCLRVLEDAGTAVERAFAVGGGANSPVWLSIMASVLDRPLDVSAAADVGAAFGAARLGQAAATGARDPGALMPPPPVQHTVLPDRALAAAYAERYDRYRALYAAAAHAADA